MKQKSISITRDLTIPMRDGVLLYAHHLRPDDGEAYPAIVVRLPYSKEDFTFGPDNPAYMRPDYYAGHGYNVYVVECRGSGRSQGVSEPDGSNELEDGYDTVEWVAHQPLCTGEVGMYGLSYFGMTQMAAACLRPPHLRAICPCQCSTQIPIYIHRGGMFVPGHLRWLYGQAQGELKLMNVSDEERARISEQIEYYRPRLTKECMHAPLVEAPAIHIPGFPYLENFVRAIDHMDDEAYWHRSGIPYRFEDFDVPMFHVTGWYDSVRSETICNERLAREQGGTARTREHQQLMIGPWVHGLPNDACVGSVNFGPQASPEASGLAERMLAWFDCYLKGADNGVQAQPRVSYFMMGENRWHTASQWPPEEAVQTPLYLDSRGHANTRRGDGRLTWTPGSGVDSYLHRPEDPVPSKPWTDMEAADPMTNDLLPPLVDETPIEEREDVLVYTTAPMTQPLDMAGELCVTLYASSSAEDTDFFCRVTDVYPDGRSMNLTEGGVRARYRSSMFEPSFVPPGEICRYVFSIGETAVRILPGHSLRVEVMSSCYPACDINMGTRERIGRQTVRVSARNTVLHDAEHPSCIMLPLLPGNNP
ncbi:MAG: CocE/NonD family hydrolase [Aristaeellaceae bacterium]